MNDVWLFASWEINKSTSDIWKKERSKERRKKGMRIAHFSAKEKQLNSSRIFLFFLTRSNIVFIIIHNWPYNEHWLLENMIPSFHINSTPQDVTNLFFCFLFFLYFFQLVFDFLQFIILSFQFLFDVVDGGYHWLQLLLSTFTCRYFKNYLMNPTESEKTTLCTFWLYVWFCWWCCWWWWLWRWWWWW